MNEPKLKSFTIQNSSWQPNVKSRQDEFDVAFARFMSEAIHVIERLMVAQGISRRELAKRVGKSESTISRQLDGDGNPTMETLAHIFVALDDEPYLSSAGFDCLARCGKSKDLRPVYTTTNAPGWLLATGATCEEDPMHAYYRPISAGRVIKPAIHKANAD